MARLSWDLRTPPAEPPFDCVNRARWRSAYRLLQQHEPRPNGRCACGEAHPCTQHRFAVRGLLDACLPSPFAGSPAGASGRFPAGGSGDSAAGDFSRVLYVSRCRWCGRGIELHPGIGWIHALGSFFVCDAPSPGSPPFSVAEPSG